MALIIKDDDQTNELLFIHEIARQVRTCFDRRVSHLGLTRSQWRALCIIQRYPEVSQNKIAELMEIEPITLARILDRMEKAGWIKRKAHPKDKRVKQISLTNKVDGILAEIRKIAVKTRKDALANFSEAEHEKLLELLSRIKTNVHDMV